MCDRQPLGLVATRCQMGTTIASPEPAQSGPWSHSYTILLHSKHRLLCRATDISCCAKQQNHLLCYRTDDACCFTQQPLSAMRRSTHLQLHHTADIIGHVTKQTVPAVTQQTTPAVPHGHCVLRNTAATACCVIQQTYLLRGAADMSAVRRSRSFCCATQQTASAVWLGSRGQLLDTTDNAGCVTQKTTPALWHSRCCLAFHTADIAC